MIEKITINTHSSIRVQGERVIYFDPYCIEEESHDADVIFITHDHYDHFEPASIEKILKDDTMMVIPRSCFDSWSESGLIVTRVLQMDPGDAIDLGGMRIEAIPAYNHLKPFHPKKKKWLGYIVEMEGRRIYVAGDTDVTEESKQVKCDIAFVPVGGKYTMAPGKAAELVNEIKPAFAVPTHYGAIVGLVTDGAAFKKAVDEDIRVVMLLHFDKEQEDAPAEGDSGQES